MSKVWFIAAAGRCIGTNAAKAALKAGDPAAKRPMNRRQRLCRTVGMEVWTPSKISPNGQMAAFDRPLWLKLFSSPRNFCASAYAPSSST